MNRVVAYGAPDDRAEARAGVAAHLGDGGLVVYPTETVYGVGCLLQPAALATLEAFKGRRPFLLLIRGREDAPGLEWTAEAERLAERFWPGPLTLALAARPGTYPRPVVGPDGAVAVRVSPHPAVAALLDAAEAPVTSTSANEPGSPPARDGDAAAGVGAALARAGARALVLDGGRLPEASPSTIVRCGPAVRLIREGAIPAAELQQVVSLE